MQVQVEVRCVAEVLSPLDFQRPQPQGLRSAEFTVGALPGSLARSQAAAALHGGANSECAIFQVGRAGYNHHGRGGCQVVWVNHVQQVPGKTGELCIQLKAHAGRQKSRSFDQAFNIRVSHLVAIQAQAACNFRESLGELYR